MREISVDNFATIGTPENLGPAPDLRWLPIASLRVDPSYQRDIEARGRTHVRRIAEGFDWRLFSAVVVSPVPGGFFAIIDGQHRTTAALLCGQESVPCQIIQADRAHQALAFEAINGRKINVSRDQRFKAALAAGEPMMLRVEQLTKKAGIRMLTFTPNGASMKPGDCLAHTAIQLLCARFPDSQALFILQCLRASAGELDGRAAISAPFIYAAIQTFEDHGEWVGNPFVRTAFEDIDPITARDGARQRVANAGRSLVLRDCIAATIVEIVTRQLNGGGGAMIANDNLCARASA